ncbi:MAG: putative toxin-antitoxin system toxin component, PIN family [Verrucomicrobia bacterium]|nr:putative toxin-antitoxin system toxin component, PIN family [Verrucomicrobiota bacterium]
MNVVTDTNVVISAIFWPGESRQCMVLWAKRRFHLAITIPIFEEYDKIARRVARKIPEVNPEPWLKWMERKAKVYEPALLGKQRSRDRNDDPFLACALASGAKTIISKDADLLVLEKPFGIEIVTPRQFLAQFR